MSTFRHGLAIAGLALGLSLASQSIAQKPVADWHAVMESSIASTGRKNGTEAVMDAFAAFFETDDIPLIVTSAVTGTTHSFNSFADVVTEVDNARIYGGMHYRHSVRDGNKLGRMVAEYTFRHYFRHKEHREHTDD